jgi:hypothetical protein
VSRCWRAGVNDGFSKETVKNDARDVLPVRSCNKRVTELVQQ